MGTGRSNHPGERIREYVIQHQAVGHLSEREVASRLNVSRSQVREVLLSLEAIGLLRRQPQSGYSYVDYNATSLMATRYFRYLVEHEAARMAQGHVSDEERRQLEAVLSDLDEAARAHDFARFSELDAQFHSMLVGLSRDPMLTHLFSYLRIVTFSRDRISAQRFKDHDEYYPLTQGNHRAILQALCEGSAEELHKWLNIHLGSNIEWRWIDEWLKGFAATGGADGGRAEVRRGRPAVWTEEQIQRARRSTCGLDLHSPQVAGLVIQLRACHNLTGEEVARLLGVSPSAIDNIVYAFRYPQDDGEGVAPERAPHGRGHRLLADGEAQGLLEPLGRRDGGASLAELQGALAARLGRPVRANYLYKLLTRLNWRRAGGRGANWLPPTP